ncbi:MAG: LamG-like jellyroll fold domain-containing protein [Verrucomicrobiota bacterium]|jgi:hypothetical protein
MKVIAALVFFLFACLTQAQSIYVAQNAQGQDTGLDAADAHSLAWLNASGNWGAGANHVGPGTTVHLLGTLTNTLNICGVLGGAVGNPVTIYFESNAMFSAPTLPNNSAWININLVSNLVVDGGVNGLLQLTDNGTVPANGGTCDYGHTGLSGISSALPTKYVTIQNVTISNLYNRQTNTEPPQGPNGNSCGIGIIDSEGGSPNCWTISNCTVVNSQNAIVGTFQAEGSSNFIITACTLSNYNWGIEFATGVTNAAFYGVFITHNILQGGDMYETAPSLDLGFHRNGIIMFNLAADDLVNYAPSNIVIAYNFFNVGFHPQTTSGGSSLLSFQNGFPQHVRIYNNIETTAYPLGVSGEAFCGMDMLVANNTIVSWQNNGTYGGGPSFLYLSGASNYAFNNIICSSCGLQAAAFPFPTNYWTNNARAAGCAFTYLSDVAAYNVYNSQTTGMVQNNGFALFVHDPNFNPLYSSTGAIPSATGASNFWPTAPFWNKNPTGSVLLSPGFMPLSIDTVAVGQGTNLTAWGITDDYAGNPRPAAGNWTIGAYQITTNGTNTIPSSGPAGGPVSAPIIVPSGGGITNFVAGGAGSDITNGLLVQYKLDQTSGTVATDSSGNGYNGTLQGNAGWTNGMAGTKAVFFPSNDGASGSADGIASSPITYSGDWTMTIWVWNNSLPGAANYAATISSGTGILVGPSSWGFYDGSTLLSGSSALGAYAWYFIAVSKSMGTNYQLYLNGGTNTAGVLANVNISYLTIGNRGGAFLGMNGCVEDFRVFNRVLSGSEISILASNGPDDVAATILAAPLNLHVVGAGP